MDEYEEYLSTPPLEADTVTNLVIWWGHHSGEWPNLSRLALDALSIPAMSADCERCFSEAGRTITDERASLEPEAIEACSCIKKLVDEEDVREAQHQGDILIYSLIGKAVRSAATTASDAVA